MASAPQPAPDSPEDRFFAEADRAASLPEGEKAEWLETVRERLAGHPRRDEIVDDIKKYLAVHQKKLEALSKVAHFESHSAYLGERLEADAVRKLEGLLSGDGALPTDDLERARVIAYIAVLGHLFKNAGARLQQPDAQEFLATALKLLARRKHED